MTKSGRFPPKNTIRFQYQKINRATLVVGAVVAGLVGFLAYGHLNSILVGVSVGIATAGTMLLTRLLIMHFGLGTDLMPKGPFIETIANRTDNDILLDEFVRLGGKSARVAAAKLQDNVGNKSISLNAKSAEILRMANEYFSQHGVLLQDNSSESVGIVKGILGCGIKQMNPALVTVKVNPQSDHLEITVDGIAKEGLIKQRAGEEAVDTVIRYLSAQLEPGA